MIKRYIASLLGAITLTFFIFLGMHYLIAPENSERPKIKQALPFEIGVVRKPEKPIVKDRMPTVIDLAMEPFDMPKLSKKETKTTIIKISSLAPPTPTDKIGPKNIGISDGDIQPIRKFAPPYPRVLQNREIEGYVVVSFTVNKMGAVENITIVESTHSAFERPSLRAVAKYKYKPRVIDGVAVAVPGVMEKISFKLEDG
ncbi:MAG: TonB family protein [Emcibacter sp.]|nr:TonB family protein [Emcibacter sp.]